MSPVSEIHTDVLVVGAGPAGLTMSAALASYGVDAVTLTRHPGTANSPRAHITNQRTMEVFRDLGLEGLVSEVATHRDFLRNNVWATSFAGREIGRLETWGTGVERSSDYEAASPSVMCNVAQHILEPAILRGAEDLGADIRFSTELFAIDQDDDGVTARMRDRLTGQENTIRAKYVVGADGARSNVAEHLGFRFTGETGLGAALNIWLEADLTKYCEHRPGTLWWMVQPGNDYWVGSGTWINVVPFTEWVLLCMYDPAEGEPDLSEESLIARAHSTIGDDTVEVRIKHVSKWQINHVVADAYRAGRAFLVGDAAHRHPPANGLGTNTSVQDSFNLAWKLSWVLKGFAGEELLDSYSAERQPVGRQVVDRALKSVQDMAPIPEALGFTPGQSSEEGWASLDDLFAPGSEDRRRRLREALDLQHYQFNAHGVDLGQHYKSSAVIDDGRPVPKPQRDRELYFTPSTSPGSPIPHAWLQKDRSRISTLDVVGHGEFTLITGIDHAVWVQAADQASTVMGIDLAVAQAGVGCAHEDVLGTWERLREVGDSGALLVRPDRIIAWRAMTAPDDPAQELISALSAVLSRPADRDDLVPAGTPGTSSAPPR